MQLLGFDNIERHTLIGKALLGGIEYEIAKDVAEIDTVKMLATGVLGDMAVVIGACELGDNLSSSERVLVTLAAQRAAERAIREELLRIRDERERKADPVGDYWACKA